MRGLIEDIGRYWPYGIAAVAGIALALTDKWVLGRHVFAVLLVLAVIAAQALMYFSPLSLGGDGYYVQALIGQLFVLAALWGYVIAWIGLKAFGRGAR